MDLFLGCRLVIVEYEEEVCRIGIEYCIEYGFLSKGGDERVFRGDKWGKMGVC